MDMIKSSEFSRSGGRFRSRYTLPALQILMLQQYPADWRDLRSPHSESNVQYDGAVELWHDQRNFQTTSPSTILISSHARISSHVFFFLLFVCTSQIHKIFRWRDKYEMLMVFFEAANSKLKVSRVFKVTVCGVFCVAFKALKFVRDLLWLDALIVVTLRM